jgi:chromosome segregation ATPase
MDHSVETRNRQLTLETLRQETQDAADALTSILKQIADEKLNLENIKKESDEESKKIRESRNDLQTKVWQIEQREILWQSNITQREKELEILAEQKTGAMRDLKNINEWIFTAKQEETKKREELESLDTEIATREKLVLGILSLKDEYAEEEKRRDTIKLENSLALDDAREALKKVHSDLETALVKRGEAAEAIVAAANELQQLIDEKERIKVDLEIYIRRIEAKYGEAFPGLRMPI